MRSAGLIAAALLAAGCAHRGAVAGMPAACRHAGDDSVLCVGWAVDLVYVGASDLAYDDPKLEAYVDGVARRVAAAAELGRDVHVRLVDGQSDGAAAMGGDIVYVDRRLLARLDSEAELAGLLAHEITHLVAGHTEDALRPDVEGGVPEAERLRRRQDDEALADERAVEIAARAGYAPEGVLAMMRAVERDDDGAPPAPGDGLDRTIPIHDHPPPTVRFARIARVVAGRAGGAVRRRAYLDHLDGLVVGDDPRRGVLRGRTWVRAASGLALEVPRGWKASLSGRALELVADDGSAAVDVRSIGRRWAGLMPTLLTGVSHRRAAGRAALIGMVPPKGTKVGAAQTHLSFDPDQAGRPQRRGPGRRSRPGAAGQLLGPPAPRQPRPRPRSPAPDPRRRAPRRPPPPPAPGRRAPGRHRRRADPRAVPRPGRGPRPRRPGPPRRRRRPHQVRRRLTRARSRGPGTGVA